MKGEERKGNKESEWAHSISFLRCWSPEETGKTGIGEMEGEGAKTLQLQGRLEKAGVEDIKKMACRLGEEDEIEKGRIFKF